MKTKGKTVTSPIGLVLFVCAFTPSMVAKNCDYRGQYVCLELPVGANVLYTAGVDFYVHEVAIKGEIVASIYEGAAPQTLSQLSGSLTTQEILGGQFNAVTLDSNDKSIYLLQMGEPHSQDFVEVTSFTSSGLFSVTQNISIIQN